MTASTPRLRAVVATDLSERLCQEIERREPRLEIVRDHRLYRPMRWPADWGGDPARVRSAEEQAAFEDLVDSAEVLFSIPDADPAALARTVRANPALRWVHVMAAGGGAQVKAAGLSDEELDRVTFTTSAGVHGSTLAEFAVLGVLAGAKDLPRLQRSQHARTWDDRWTMRHLDEMTVLVVGLGGIGKAAAQRFAAFGATVWGTNRSGRAVEGVDRIVPVDELVTAVSDVDAIVVTLPGTDGTEHLIGEEVLRAAKPGVILANVGRGTVVDESALLGALDDGRVSYAALDVFETEPLPSRSPLWDHPRVLVSPHTAALSTQEDVRIARLFADNARRLLDGEPLRNVVDTVEFY
ncbi:D-2-hydroxyacid dehydrogenase [Microbacterium betulae]|uniref:D-2-hydroxyacid dehydrogenase n=1 Tax=Microbacterium betulae TaxID=2981139 RepID=A0AA97I5J0_9MICO|nr:D-2-hydroxyacid dehydrogenase [Microbacterium sp. AB]WOF22152.1 D-2-hydroxyacid dehydrogenase [Microbacterium sp. AB]